MQPRATRSWESSLTAAGNEFHYLGPSVKLDEPWSLSSVDGIQQRQTYDGLDVRFVKSQDVNYYHARKSVAALPNTWYRFTGWIKTEKLTSSNGACFQVGDLRGWVATKSCQITKFVTGTQDWQKVEVDYQTLPDTTGIEVIARRLSGTGEVTGRACYRDVSIRPIDPPRLAGVPFVSITASRSADGKTIGAVLVNKRFSSTRLGLMIGGRGLYNIEAWALSGPSVDATNEKIADNVKIVSVEAYLERGYAIDLPPHSIVGLIFTRR